MTDTNLSLEALFSAQMQLLDPERAPGSLAPLELLLDDHLPVRITLHPDSRHWVVEAFAYDAVAILGPLRRSLVKTLLQINAAALEGEQIICTLDGTDLVVVMTRWAVQEADSSQFLPWLEYTVDQARRIREAVRAIAMHGDEMAFAWQTSPTQGASAWSS